MGWAWVTSFLRYHGVETVSDVLTVSTLAAWAWTCEGSRTWCGRWGTTCRAAGVADDWLADRTG